MSAQARRTPVDRRRAHRCAWAFLRRWSKTLIPLVVLLVLLAYGIQRMSRIGASDVGDEAPVLRVHLDTASGPTCESRDTGTCEMNIYGGAGSLRPGPAGVVSVTLTNPGHRALRTVTMSAGECTSDAPALCTSGIRISISVRGHVLAPVIHDLSPAELHRSGIVSVTGGIPAGERITLQFALALDDVSPAYGGAGISQPLRWAASVA